MKIFNGYKFVMVDPEKGVGIKARHDQDWIELVDGTWIQAMRIRYNRYYDKEDHLWTEAYSKLDADNEEYELSGLFYRVIYSTEK